MTLGVSANTLALFLVVLARVGGVIGSAPVIGDRQVPRLVKAGLALALSFVLVALPGLAHTRIPTAIGPFVVMVVTQLLIGLVLGFVARVLFFAVQVAGEIVSMQTGLSMASILNPLTQQPSSVLTQFYNVIAVLTFLATNGDAWIVAALARSFDLAPLGTPVAPHFIGGATSAALSVTQLGLGIALPIAASLFGANVVLGVVSRSLPQLNVFVLSMPLNLIIGLLALIGSLAGAVIIISHLTGALPQTMLEPLG